MSNMSNTKQIKRQRFIRVVETRVSRLLEAFDNVGKCSNRANYEYSDEDVKEIFKEIGKKMRETKMLFEIGSKERPRFKLKI